MFRYPKALFIKYTSVREGYFKLKVISLRLFKSTLRERGAGHRSIKLRIRDGYLAETLEKYSSSIGRAYRY